MHLPLPIIAILTLLHLTTAFPHLAKIRNPAPSDTTSPNTIYLPELTLQDACPPPLETSPPLDADSVTTPGNEHEEAHILAHLLDAYRARHGHQIVIESRDDDEDEGNVEMDIENSGSGWAEKTLRKGVKEFLLVSFLFFWVSVMECDVR